MAEADAMFEVNSNCPQALLCIIIIKITSDYKQRECARYNNHLLKAIEQLIKEGGDQGREENTGCSILGYMQYC